MTTTAPTLTGSSYDAATGVLTLTGKNLTKAASDYTATGLTLAGEGGARYTLTGGSAVAGKPTGSSVKITLSAADQQAVDGLLNKNGGVANDGSSHYSLSASAGWDTGAAAISGQAVSVNHTFAPGLGKVSYTAATGVFTITTGSHLTDGIDLSHFSFQNLFQFNSSDTVSQLTRSGFDITLSAADQATVNNLLIGLNTGKLNASAGWDNDSGAAVVAKTVSVVPGISAASYNATTGQLALTGKDLTTSAAGYAPGHFTLSGEGGASYTLTGGVVVAGSQTTNGVTLQLGAADQQALAALLDLNGTAASDHTAYTLSATAGWDTKATAISSEAVSVSGVPQPAVGSVGYNAATGQLTLAGTHLIASGYVPADFTLSGEGGARYTLTGGSVVAGSASSGGVTLQLNAADQQAVDNLLDYNGNSAGDGTAYNLTATAGWDTNATAISGQAVTVSGGLYPYVLLHTLSVGVNFPDSLAVDSQGDVFVANMHNSTVEKFSASGTLLQTLSNGVGYPNSVAVDGQGDVFVANQSYYSNNETLVSPDIEEFSANGILLRTLSNGVNNPSCLAVDDQGDVFVASSDNHYMNSTVEEFSANGTLLRTLSTGLADPSSVAVDSHGDVFVTNWNSNTVEEFSATGTLLLTLSNGLGNPNSVAVDGQGDIFVANLNGKHNVEEFSADGTLLRTLSKGLNSPSSVAVDSHGDVFVANFLNGPVEEFSANGSLLQTLSTGANSYLHSLVLDSHGDVFVANTGNNTVEEFGVQLLGVSPPAAL